MPGLKVIHAKSMKGTVRLMFKDSRAAAAAAAAVAYRWPPPLVDRPLANAIENKQKCSEVDQVGGQSKEPFEAPWCIPGAPICLA